MQNTYFYSSQNNKDRLYANKPETIEALKYNIRRDIALKMYFAVQNIKLIEKCLLYLNFDYIFSLKIIDCDYGHRLSRAINQQIPNLNEFWLLFWSKSLVVKLHDMPTISIYATTVSWSLRSILI